MIALILTFSRSAIVVGIISTGLTLWQKFPKKRYLIFLFAFIFLITYHVSRIAPNDESIIVRQQLNQAAVKLWQQSPLVGIGLGNFLVKLPEALPSRSVYFLQPVHNIYLLLLSEAGVIGFLFFLFLLWMIYQKKPFGIWHLAFGILLILGFIDHYPLTLQQGQLLLTLVLSLNLVASQRKIS